MNSEKTDGVVLRIVEFSETSCIVTWFTKDFGKITTMAKGARRRKNPFEGALDVLAMSRLVFLRKSTDALDLLTEAKLERRFRVSERSLPRLYCGYHVAELMYLLFDPYDPHPALYEQMEAILVELHSDSALIPVVTWFELQLLKELGHSPSWRECVNCGCRLPDTPRVAFAPIEGGVVCAQCRVGRRQVVSVSKNVIDYLESLALRPMLDELPQAPKRNWGEGRGLMGQLLQHLIGRPLRVLPNLGFLAHVETPG